MSYKPIHAWKRKDKLPSKDPQKIIYGKQLQDEFDAIADGVGSLENQLDQIQGGPDKIPDVVEEAPNDGVIYGRANKTWVPVQGENCAPFSEARYGVGRYGIDLYNLSSEGGGSAGGSCSWDEISDKPSTYPPSSHTHSTSQVTGLDSRLDGIDDSIGGLEGAVGSLATQLAFGGSYDAGTGLVIKGNLSQFEPNSPLPLHTDVPNTFVIVAKAGDNPIHLDEGDWLVAGDLDWVPINYGTAGAVEWENIQNKPQIDNYQYWQYKVDGFSTTNVGSTQCIDFQAGSNISIEKDGYGIKISAEGGASNSELVDGDAYIRLEDGSWVASPSMTFEGDLTVNGNITIDGGQIVDPEGNPSGGPSTHVGPDAPDPAVEGQLWLNTDDGYLYVYYNNAGNPTWMAVEREGGSGGGGGDGGGGFALGSILIKNNNAFVDSAPITSDALTFGTGDFSVEFWFRGTGERANILNPASKSGAGTWGLFLNGGNIQWNNQYNAANLLTADAGELINGLWHHIYIVRASGTTNMFWDGSANALASASDSNNYSQQITLRTGKGNVTQDVAFEIADLRIVKGGRAYSSYDSRVVPSGPLDLNVHSGEVALLLNGNASDGGFVDASGYDYTFTPSGDVQITTDSPYGARQPWRYGYPDIEATEQGGDNDADLS